MLLIPGISGLALLEIGLRAYKTLTYDGLLYVSGPSPNNMFHPKYGWISPRSAVYQKNDGCYGRGPVIYNSEGFRAPPLAEAERAWPIVCILGDSTMQGYQIPDGKYLPHLLRAELKKAYPDVYVLPLAVGGYGTLQEYMLYQDICRPLEPDLIIWHWAENDPVNNSFLAERSGKTSNNARRRPYFEGGQIVYKRPYPIHLSDYLDGLMILKIANTIALTLQSKPPLQEHLKNIERGWVVSDHFIGLLAKNAKSPLIALVPETAIRATEMFRRHGYRIATYKPFSEEATCKPRDDHPNQRGHSAMLEVLLPTVCQSFPRICGAVSDTD